jgi:hypothetical protein
MERTEENKAFKSIVIVWNAILGLTSSGNPNRKIVGGEMVSKDYANCCCPDIRGFMETCKAWNNGMETSSL